jgi:hypothetical protein
MISAYREPLTSIVLGIFCQLIPSVEYSAAADGSAKWFDSIFCMQRWIVRPSWAKERAKG